MNFSSVEPNGINLTNATRLVLITDKTSEDLVTTANGLKESDPELDKQILLVNASESPSYITDSKIESYPCLLSIEPDGDQAEFLPTKTS